MQALQATPANILILHCCNAYSLGILTYYLVDLVTVACLLKPLFARTGTLEIM